MNHNRHNPCSKLEIAQAIYRLLLARAAHNNFLQDIADRHILQFVPNVQCIKALQESGWKNHDDFEDMIVSRSNCISVTQLVEDVNACQTNLGATPCRKFRRPALAMASTIDKKVLSIRHHYKDLDVVRAAVSKTQALPKTAFEPSGATADPPDPINPRGPIDPASQPIRLT